MAASIAGIIAVLVKIGYLWLQGRDPEFVRRFDEDLEEIDKFIAERNSTGLSIKYSELFKRARSRNPGK